MNGKIKILVNRWISQIGFRTIRFRLFFGFIAIAILTVVSLSVGTLWVGYLSGRDQAVSRMLSVSANNELEIGAWLDDIQNELFNALKEQYALDRIEVLLTLDQIMVHYDFYHKAVRTRLNAFVINSIDLEEIMILNNEGEVILSTIEDHEGITFQDQDFFLKALDNPSTHAVLYPDDDFLCGMIVAIPVINSSEEQIGVILGRASFERLGKTLSRQEGLGETGKSYLLSENNEIFSGEVFTNELECPQMLLDTQSQNDYFQDMFGVNTIVSSSYENHDNHEVISVYRWLPSMEMALIVEQDSMEIYRFVFTSLKVNLGIAILAIILALFISLIITQSIARPIDNLVKTTSLIAAGDLGRTALVEREDEVGKLAISFNAMTARLAKLIHQLERTVDERTIELQEHAIQLETSLQVSQEVTSILNVEDLLIRIVKLLKKSFNYYQIHIYLVEAESKGLKLHSSSFEGNLEHREVAISQDNYIGKAVLLNDQVFVKNTQRDDSYLFDPKLPDVRSAVVVPLVFGEDLIGAMVILSKSEDGFDKQGIKVLQSLADQLAVAIENARRYDKSKRLAVFEERTRLARELHDSVTQSLYSLGLLIEGWKMQVHSAEKVNIEEFLDRSSEINQEALREMRLLIHELRPPILEKLGLWGALIYRLDAVEKRAGIKTNLEVEDFVEFPSNIEECLYRVAQEALNNALKHSENSSVTIRLEMGTPIVFTISDNGKGFVMENEKDSGGMGLVSMAERVEGICGELNIETNPGEGTSVRITLPRSKNEISPKNKTEETGDS
ncbi:MAG: DUF484 family protein [Anaerolineaceae bacterium]|nr:DUF484 family protein [Anaerolineaceae bacterium]